MPPRMIRNHEEDDEHHGHEPEIRPADQEASNIAHVVASEEPVSEERGPSTAQTRTTVYDHRHSQSPRSLFVTRISIPSSLSSPDQKSVSPDDPLTRKHFTTEPDLRPTSEISEHSAVRHSRRDNERFAVHEMSQQLGKDVPAPVTVTELETEQSILSERKVTDRKNKQYESEAADLQNEESSLQQRLNSVTCSCTEVQQTGHTNEQETTLTGSNGNEEKTTPTVSMATTTMKTETVDFPEVWNSWVKQYLRRVLEGEEQQRGYTSNFASAERSQSPLFDDSSDETAPMPTLTLQPKTLTPIARPPSRHSVQDLPNSTPANQDTFSMSSATSHPTHSPRRMIFNGISENIDLPHSRTQPQTATLPSAPTIPVSGLHSTANNTLLRGGYTGLDLDFAFPPFPLYGKLFFTAILALAVTWCVLVYLVNFPESVLLRWSKRGAAKHEEKRRAKKARVENRRWAWLRSLFNFSWLWNGSNSEGGKIKKIGNLDEPSKYERSPTEAQEDMPLSSFTTSSEAKSSAFTTIPLDSGVPLRRRRRGHSYPQSQPQQTPRSTSAAGASNITTPSKPKGKEREDRSPSTSPENPFIPCISPLNRRSSSEWLRERMQFLFGNGVGVEVYDSADTPSSNSTLTNGTHSVGPSTSTNRAPATHLTPNCPPNTRLPTARPVSPKPALYDPESQLSFPSPSTSPLASKRSSWYRPRTSSGGDSPMGISDPLVDAGIIGFGEGHEADSWLSRFDNAVNRVVDGIARFTNDDGGRGEGEALLPLRN